MVELHREGSAPAACAAGLFTSRMSVKFWPTFSLSGKVKENFQLQFIKGQDDIPCRRFGLSLPDDMHEKTAKTLLIKEITSIGFFIQDYLSQRTKLLLLWAA